MKDLLIVVDMQNDFIDGALGTPEACAIVGPLAKFLGEFEGEVIFTRDTHGEDYLNTKEGQNLPVKHCIKDSFGWQISEELLPFVKNGAVIDKPTFGSRTLAERVWKMSLDAELRVTLVGLCTDICVISNAMLIKAFVPEAEIRVIGNLCAGVTPESHERALLSMRSCQISVI